MSVPESSQTPITPAPSGNPLTPGRFPLQGWLNDLWDAARFRPAVFTGLAARHDAFLQGFVIVLVISLLTGVPGFFAALTAGAQAPSAGETAEASTAIRDALEAAGPVLEGLGVPADTRAAIVEQVTAAFGLALQIGQEVDQLPTVLPRPVGRALAAFGGWVSRPFSSERLPLAVASLGAWLGYGVWVMLAARLLGGRGSLHGFLGATALYAVPHVLDLFRWLPFIGGAIGLIAYFWGAAIYIKATQASHGLTFERALLAVLLPLGLLVLLLASVFSVLAGVSWLTN